MRLLSIVTIALHRPRFFANAVTGCNGCEWTCPQDGRDTWVEYLWHIPVATSDGELALNREDMNFLAEAHIAVRPLDKIR